MPILSRFLIRTQTALLTSARDTRLHFSSRCCSGRFPEGQMAAIVGNPRDFYNYTSGRWMWDEEEQLRERYREFDILELQKVAMEATCGASCVSMEKIGEGSYNKSFRLTMADGKTVVARIPNPNAGPAFLTTASEVATMDFLRKVLHVPVPKVLSWNARADSANRVGAEYIIMEHAPGKNLADHWPDMDLEHKVQTMEDIVTIQQKLLSVRFSHRYGCLFFSNDAPTGSHPATVQGDELSHELRENIAEQFSTGPVVDTAFWRKERGDMDMDRGPWESAVDYLKSLAHREIAWIRKHATPRSSDDPLFVSPRQNDPAEHLSLLHRYLSVVPHLLPKDEEVLDSFLWHTDLRTPNIFVNDTGNITSIIDWQSTWAGPLFLEGRQPHFLDYNGELLLELPENFRQLDEDTQKTVKDQVTKSILLYLYEKYTAERNPVLNRVLRYPNGKILTNPVRFVGNTWDGDILPLRESLIQVQKNWDLLDRTIECPISFSPEEIRRHYEDGEGWNEVQDFWDAISGIMGRDGWTSHETYDQAMAIYSELQAIAASHSNHDK